LALILLVYELFLIDTEKLKIQYKLFRKLALVPTEITRLKLTNLFGF